MPEIQIFKFKNNQPQRAEKNAALADKKVA